MNNEGFWKACSEGQLNNVRDMQDSPNIDVNFRSGPKLDPPITAACRNGHTEIVEMLLKNPRVNVSVGNRGGAGPLVIAAQEGKIPIIDALLKDPRIDINHAITDGRTALYMACQEGANISVDRLLLDERLDPRKTLYRAQTPQSIAREKGHVQSFEKIKQHIRQNLKITLEDDFQYLRKNLRKDSPNFLNAISCMRDILEDPETRELALVAPSVTEGKNFIHQFLQNGSGLSADDFFVYTWTVKALSIIESVRRSFFDHNGYAYVMKMFLETCPQVGDYSSILPVRLLLSAGVDVQESISKGFGDLLINLHRMLSTNIDYWIKVDISSLILLLSGYYPNDRNCYVAAKDFVFKAGHSADFCDRAFDGLMQASAVEVSRPILLSLGLKEYVAPHISSPESPKGFCSCLIQALLSASDVSTTSESGGEATNPVAVNQILKSFNKFTTSKIQWITTMPSYHAEFDIFLVALRSMATNEENKKILKDGHLIQMVLDLFDLRSDLLLDNRENFTEACNLVWVLSFDPFNREELAAGKMVEKLKAFPAPKEGAAKKAYSGALWNLEGKEKQVQAALSHGNQAEKNKAVQGTTGHIMISYSWAQKERMRQIGMHLKDRGFPVWLDIEQMEGSVLETMSEAVEDSAVLIIGLSSNYKESQACRTEAEYAYRLKKEVIFVMAEDGYTPKGWLGAMLGNKLWYNPWGNGGFAVGIQEIEKQIAKFIHPNTSASAAEGKPASTTAPVPSSAAINIKVPENSEPLLAHQLTLEGIKAWGLEEVCRWLRMNHLEKLLIPFAKHQITGRVLIEWANSIGTARFDQTWNSLGVDGHAVSWEFYLHLRELFSSPRSWKNAQVVDWLNLAGLPEVGSLAKNQDWDGSVLLGLNEVRRDISFSHDCKELGLSKIQELKLKGKLVELFEFSNI